MLIARGWHHGGPRQQQTASSLLQKLSEMHEKDVEAWFGSLLHWLGRSDCTNLVPPRLHMHLLYVCVCRAFKAGAFLLAATPAARQASSPIETVVVSFPEGSMTYTGPAPKPMLMLLSARSSTW